MKEPKISIIVPVYNATNYIDRCITSIFKQTLNDFEAILIDDCSKDNSVEFITDLIGDDERFILIKNKVNRGVGKSRNLGLKIANGKYILFIDSDDWIHPRTCEILSLIADENNLEVLEGGYQTISHPSEEKTTLQLGNYSCKHVSTGINYLSENNYVSAVWNRLWLKEHIQNNKVDFFEHITYGEDVKFSFNGIYKSSRFCKVDFMFYNYFQSENSLSRAVIGDKHFLGQLAVLKFFQEHYDQSTTKEQKILLRKLLTKSVVHATKLLRDAAPTSGLQYRKLKKENRQVIRLIGFSLLKYAEIHPVGRLMLLLSPNTYNLLHKLKQFIMNLVAKT